MTKEQLIELIQTNIPDGDLVDVVVNNKLRYQIYGTHKDPETGLYNILIQETLAGEDPKYLTMKNALSWKNAGLKSDISQWKEINGFYVKD